MKLESESRPGPVLRHAERSHRLPEQVCKFGRNVEARRAIGSVGARPLTRRGSQIITAHQPGECLGQILQREDAEGMFATVQNRLRRARLAPSSVVAISQIVPTATVLKVVG